MDTSKSVLPEGVREGNENLIALTEAAAHRLQGLLQGEPAGSCLRVSIVGGGCSGLSYNYRFTDSPKRGDILVRSGGVPVLVDSRSALYLKGTRMDYSDRLVAGGFKFSNPNAKASCSCGESFAV